MKKENQKCENGENKTYIGSHNTFQILEFYN